MGRNVVHRYRYKFSDDPELERIERQYFGDSTKGSAKYIRNWVYRTAIFHYSNGTNRCSVEGCNAPICALTLEHENFDRRELGLKLNLSSANTGVNLAKALVNAGFPDIGITIKCMKHNQLNRHPNTISDLTGRKIYKIEHNKRTVKQAYELYGYFGPLEGMTFEHSNNDGAKHRKYLVDKYNLKIKGHQLGSNKFAFYIIKEHKNGVNNWPGLIIADANKNHCGMLEMRRKESNEDIN